MRLWRIPGMPARCLAFLCTGIKLAYRDDVDDAWHGTDETAGVLRGVSWKNQATSLS